MSKIHPECPLYNHLHCKDYDNPKLCAIIREDKICVKKKPQSVSKKVEEEDSSFSKVPFD